MSDPDPDPNPDPGSRFFWKLEMVKKKIANFVEYDVTNGLNSQTFTIFQVLCK